ncbi:MFS transporter [Actinomadura roseirufa]|uniref:MFS transporter n=1 Tax=Actinomadura roseirufa TaxID=2094049 RepID=UPI001A95587A|nr:MFS transporter [Actinomadura roseirufa]
MRRWWPLAAICMGSFLFLVDTTIVTVALPSIAGGLHAPLEALQWVANVYTLVLAVLMLTAGSLADRYGHRRVYMAGLVVFAAASAGCALAPDAATLVAARGVQGVGGAALAVTAFSLIGAIYEGPALRTAMGVWGAVSGLGAASGPLLGGLLAQGPGWRAIFLVNLPVAAAALVLTLRAVPADRPAATPPGAGLDPVGTILFAVGAGLLTDALTRAGADGWRGGGVLVRVGAAAVALALFVAAELRHRRPMLDPRLFRAPGLAAVLACVLASSAAFSCLVYTAIWLRSGLGLGPVRTGLTMMPMALTAFAVSTVTGRPRAGIPPRAGLGGGLLLSGAGCALQAGLDGGSTASSLTVGLVVTGAGVGLMLPAMGTAVLTAAPPDRRGTAAGAMTTFRQLGQTLGVAALGALFQSGAGARARGESDAAALAAGLDRVYLAAAALGIAAGLLALAAAGGRDEDRPSGTGTIPEARPAKAGRHRD